MLTLIKSVELYTPEYLGTMDVLFSGNQLIATGSELDVAGNLGDSLKTVDGSGKVLFPGFVDMLVHFSGGGGEGGFHTRTPEMPLTDATLAGVTTVVGALGTDDVSRTLEDLLAKANGLENEGLSTYCYTGSYQVPIQTVTGSVRRDIMLIDKFIGVGEVAIADHRGSHPSTKELIRIAADAKVAGMLSGKKGTIFLHLGDHEDKFSGIHEVIEQSAHSAEQFVATHVNRSGELLSAGIEFARCGGFIDMTTSTVPALLEMGEVPAAQAVLNALESGINLSQLTMSSDGNASLPIFDSEQNLVGLEVGKVSSLYDSFKQLVELKLPLQSALAVVSANPANALGLKTKGQISSSHDVDLVLADKDDLTIDSVWAKGQLMVEQGIAVKRGTFE